MISNSGIHSSPKDSGICSTERSKAAEIAAGVAAAQAVAALRIAEEARAEAEAAKKAAEAAISQILDRRYFAVTEAKQQHVTFYSPNIEAERDALKAQLEETERRLKEKTRQVFHLEQSLDDMTQYLLRLKSNLSLQNNVSENERELSERGSTNLAESFHGTNS
ncbi:hypothetical protein KP509_01G007800 [Ceratopteris richardii]|nr:hypothetical protein KP509_01G007800 [Ceratopteris richardii]